MEKAGRIGLVSKKVQVTRGGTTFPMTVYVREGKEERKSNSARGIAEPKTEDDKKLMDVIAKMEKFMQKHTSMEVVYKNGYDMVFKEGRYFAPAERPLDISKDADKECFKNAALLAMANPKYTYVEGFATIKSLGALPISHAWVVDKKGNVVDSTWKTPGTSYYGIPFKTEFLEKTIVKTKVWGLIPEMPSKKYNPFKDGFPKGVIDGK